MQTGYGSLANDEKHLAHPCVYTKRMNEVNCRGGEVGRGSGRGIGREKHGRYLRFKGLYLKLYASVTIFMGDFAMFECMSWIFFWEQNGL